ncbi:MAG: hypothetical protein WD009_07285 [Phycisphaeraceae bacterium]
MTPNGSRTIRTSLTVIGAVALALAAAPATPALAQEQVDTSGRALDANPRSGAGGINDAGPVIDYRARNDIITGNVGGGRHFRGDIDYGAPGEFRGQLGSDDLFRWRADSLPSAPSQPGGAYPGSVYRPYSTPTRPSIDAAGRTSDQWNYDLGGYGAPVDRRLTPGGLGTWRDDDLLVRPDPTDGRILESPLMGVRTWGPDVDTWEQPLDDDNLQLPGRPGDDPADDPNIDDPDQLEEDRRQQLEAEVGWREIEWRRGRQLRDDTLTEARRDTRVSPSLMLGDRLRSEMGGGWRDGPADPAAREGLERLAERLYGPLDDHYQPGADAYLDLLAAVRGHGSRPPLAGADPEDDRPVWERLDPRNDADWEQWWQEHQAERRQREQQVAEREAEDPIAELMPVERGEMEEAETRRQQVLREIYGDEAAELPEFGDAEEPDALTLMLEDLSYDLPRLETLAGDADDRVQQLMREGEEALGGGEYFAAEGIFRQAVRHRPDDPLARMGLIHAQMGAGMIRTAAMQLRHVFDEHPEVIAARYEGNLLPGEERLRWLQGELQRMISEGADRPEDAALMLAYLGYQVDSRQLVRYGLARAEAIEPEDGLFTLLRRIWIEADDEGADEAQE